MHRTAGRRNLGLRGWLVACLLGLMGSAALLAQAPRPAAGTERLQSEADQVLQEMSRITGLPVKGPLRTKILSRQEIRRFLESSLDLEYPPPLIRKEEASLKAFGLVGQEFDLRGFLLTFYAEQAAGIYDPRSKTLMLADWPSEAMQSLVLAHELTHALQDQNFDLLQFMHAERDNADATAARQAVMEGHATAAMLQRMMADVPVAALPSLQPIFEGVIHQQLAEFPAFSQAPYFFRLGALFPYVYGIGFVQRLVQANGGWKGLASVFRNPPSQTREILAPGLYLEGSGVQRIVLPRPPVLEATDRFRWVAENSLGQLGFMGLLGQLTTKEEAEALAPQWRADRYVVYEDQSSGQFSLAVRARWADPEWALVFFRTYHAILAKKYPSLVPDPRSRPDLFIGAIARGNVILLRRGDECRWAEGIPPEGTNAMLEWLESL